jgi:hypothetical protein
MEDIGFIPTIADWFLRIQPAMWMDRPRKLAKELEREPEAAS